MKTEDIFILDFDGTICDLEVDWKSLKQEVRDLFSENYAVENISFSSLLENICSDQNNRKIVLDLLEKYEQPNGFAIVANYRESFIESLPFYYIISNNLHSTVQRALERLGCIDKCRGIIGFDTLFQAKPNSMAFDYLRTNDARIDLARVIYVGDMETDEVFANRNNVQFKYIHQIIEGK